MRKRGKHTHYTDRFDYKRAKGHQDGGSKNSSHKIHEKIVLDAQVKNE